MITSIEIENVKGYGSPAKVYDLQLRPDRVNLLIAPNGYGKSSLAAAFGALTGDNLALSEEDKHEPHMGAPRLTITMDGSAYSATEGTNTISPVLDSYVIHNRLDVHAKANHFGRRTQVFSHLKVTPITICRQVPAVLFPSLTRDDKSVVGNKIRLFSGGLSELNNHHFAFQLKGLRNGLGLFDSQVGRSGMISSIIGYIATSWGTADYFSTHYDSHVFDAIEQDEYYIQFSNLLSRYFGQYDSLRKFLVFYQLIVMYKKNHRQFTDACEYAKYCSIKEQFDKSLAMLDTTSRNIQTKEEDGWLKVSFPKAKTISNGQRDVLTFIVDLLCFKAKVDPSRKSLLIIDEIFDYLDDANTLAAQYFLTDILEEYRGNIYLVLLTHLSPDTFRNYVFSDKKINVQYLKPNNIRTQDAMKKFIAFRQRLDRNDAIQDDLYGKVSHYLLHFSPKDIDLVARMRPFEVAGMKTSWGRKDDFQTYLIEELNKYLCGTDSYDPYAVAVALRIRSEVIIYNLLPTQEIKDAFEDEKETKKKFAYAEDHGVVVPSPLYAVAAIHNEADHIRIDNNGNIKDTPMIYKLEHSVVRQIIAKLFNYCNGVPVTIASLKA